MYATTPARRKTARTPAKRALAAASCTPRSDMPYELAKQLKDAGFPQDRKRGWFVFRDPKAPDAHFQAYIPTLSELIEACGDDFVRLTRYTYSGGKIGWYASPKAFLGFQQVAPEEHLADFHGSTPEEAVAHLFLALHSKGRAKLDKSV